jgi:RNA polymerase sigma-70 factor (ECF subfamily)
MPPMFGSILVTNEQGIALYANDGIARRTGFSVAEIIDTKPGKLWGGRMPRSFYQGMWQALRDEQSGFVGTVTNRSKTGNEYEELLVIAPLEAADRSIHYLALRPARIAEASQFVSEWRTVFDSPRVRTNSVLPWIEQWFPAESRGKTGKNEGLFADWIRQHWVGALRDRFRRRIDDRTLVAAAKADPLAYQAIYEKYFETIERYFMRHLPGNRDQALDLTQDTFIRAFERLDGYETRNAAYGTYLLRIAHSILLNSFRRQPFVGLSAVEVAPVSAAPSLIATDWIWEMPELSPRERVVLSAYYREGYSVREISVRLGHSENATKLLLSRARKKLRPLFTSS